jgi:hypothetical protein
VIHLKKFYKKQTMAELEQGDPRWIVKDYKDGGHNIGNWHWEGKINIFKKRKKCFTMDRKKCKFNIL